MKSSVDAMFGAFANHTRLRMMNLLATGELTVTDLVEVLDVPQPTASRHLRVLKDAHLVRGRRDGHWIHYSLAVPDGGFHAQLVGCLGSCFNDVPELRRDQKRLTKLTGARVRHKETCVAGSC